MIDPRVIDEYLDREWDSYLWIKKARKKELLRAIKENLPDAKIEVPLREHQLACFYLGAILKQFFFILDMGTGKTLLTLALLRYFMQTGQVRRPLVLVPSDDTVGGWEDQIAKWYPDMPYVGLTGSSQQKWETLFDTDEGLVIVSYPGLVWMGSGKVKDKRKGRSRLKPNKKLVDRLCDNVDALVLDESTEVANKGSLAWRIASKISERVEVRYALAGRPFGRDPLPLWAQFYLIDHGETFGPNLGFFREVYYTKKRGYWTMFEYELNKKRKPLLSRAMEHRSISYEAAECIDLPKKSVIQKWCSFPEEAEEYYKKYLQQIQHAQGNKQVIQNAFIRMRQISSGFIGFKDDETGERAEVEFDVNPKLDLLMELISQIPRGKKWLVFYEYTWTGRRICEELKARKIKHGWIWGGEKESTAIRRQFDRDPEMDGLVINHKKGSLGLNLQVASYELVMESPLSVIDREQMERRIERDGQLEDCVFIYDLLMRGTFDYRILQFHAQGRNLYNDLVRNPAKVLEGIRP